VIEKDENTLLEAVARLTPQWLAGFFDGEGCVYAALDINGRGHGRERTWVKVELHQKDPVILGLVGMKFECSWSRARTVSTKTGGTTTGHSITWQGTQAIEFLKFIRPHVIVKRRLVELALSFCEMLEKVGGKLKNKSVRSTHVPANSIPLRKESYHGDGQRAVCSIDGPRFA
jgi:hypothetical protein